MRDEASLEQAFERILATRMAGIPILNPALSVQAVGFRDWNGLRAGVLVTPWAINLVVLHGAAGDIRPLGLDERRHWTFPSGRYEFMGGDEPECGSFDFCSLFSPPHEFTDQAVARSVAESVMTQLFAAPEPAPRPSGGPAPVSRRAILALPEA